MSESALHRVCPRRTSYRYVHDLDAQIDSQKDLIRRLADLYMESDNEEDAAYFRARADAERAVLQNLESKKYYALGVQLVVA